MLEFRTGLRRSEDGSRGKELRVLRVLDLSDRPLDSCWTGRRGGRGGVGSSRRTA
jgi:hypothetical protein